MTQSEASRSSVAFDKKAGLRAVEVSSVDTFPGGGSTGDTRRVETAVLIVTWNHARFIRRCLASLERAILPPGGARVLILDNASTDGTACAVRAYLAERPRAAHRRMPIDLLCADQNLGFAAGMNVLLSRAQKMGARFFYLLNPDTEVHPAFLTRALDAFCDPEVGIVQSLIRFRRDPDVINTAGNSLHWLGFGYVSGAPAEMLDHLNGAYPTIGYASGAGMAVREEVLRTVGTFDPRLFAYHEDLDLSWRARIAGWQVVLAPLSVVYHDYEFDRHRAKLFLAERNRVVVTLSCYEVRTLALLWPALLAVEGAVWGGALLGGWWREKWRALRSLLDLDTLRWIGHRRRAIGRARRVPDIAVMKHMTHRMPWPAAAPRIVRVLGDAVLRLYCRAACGALRVLGPRTSCGTRQPVATPAANQLLKAA